MFLNRMWGWVSTLIKGFSYIKKKKKKKLKSRTKMTYVCVWTYIYKAGLEINVGPSAIGWWFQIRADDFCKKYIKIGQIGWWILLHLNTMKHQMYVLSARLADPLKS